MTEIPNPYLDEAKQSPFSDTALRLSNDLQAVLALFAKVRLTSDEHEALTKVMEAVVRNHPWLVGVMK